MRYVKDQKLNTRNRIVEAASLVLRGKGADGISVVDVMKLAGLTHGGFESRDALVIEAFALAMDRTVPSWLQLVVAKPMEEQFETVVESYLATGRHALRIQAASRRKCIQEQRISGS